MKKFSEYLQESTVPAYVVVRNNRVELRLMNVGAPIATFAHGAVYAIITGDMVQVNLRSGKTVFYKLSKNQSSVSGPYIK